MIGPDEGSLRAAIAEFRKKERRDVDSKKKSMT